MFEDTQLARVNIQSSESFPVWVMAHYIDVVEANYRKLYTIGKLAELRNSGFDRRDFSVSTASAPLYMREKFDVSSIKESVKWDNYDENSEFWYHVLKLKRPVVFIDRGGDRKNLYDPNGEEGLRIVSASVSTPISIDFSGFDKIIHTLFFGRNQERREQEAHEAHMRIENIKFMREVVGLKSEIAKSNMTEQEKSILNFKIDELLHSQLSNDIRMGSIVRLVQTEPLKPRGNINLLT
jgi:hypothetical protein